MRPSPVWKAYAHKHSSWQREFTHLLCPYAIFLPLYLLLLLAPQLVLAQNSSLVIGNNNTLEQSAGDKFPAQPLPVDEAFAISILALPSDPTELRLNWTIAPGYYLYKKSIMVKTQRQQFELGKQLPLATEIEDEFFGKVEVYFDRLELQLPLAGSEQVLNLELSYQGCATGRYCYPPVSKLITVQLP